MHDLLTQLLILLNAVWRHRALALVVAWLVCAISWTIVELVPDNYKASARVYVDTANILKPLLKGVAVDYDLQAEVELMQRTLLTRPNLSKVARMTDLDLDVRTPEDMEHLLKRLDRRISVGRVGHNLFSIGYSDIDPQKARDVVQALLTIFVETNLGQSRRDMDSARRFIDEQVEDYEKQLERAERKLAEFKQANMGLLSGQLGYQVRLERTEARLAEEEAELGDAISRRDTLRRELESIPQFFYVDPSDRPTGPPSDTDVRILELELQLEELLSHYTEKHPDVVVVQRRLDALRKQHKAELSTVFGPAGGSNGETQDSPGQGVPNTMYEQIKLLLVQEEGNIASHKKRSQEARQDLDELLGKAAQVPIIEAELIKLNRDYDVLKIKYEELLSRREAGRISRARELGGQEVQYRVVEPPEVPVLPTGPNRIVFLTLVLVAGISSGLGFAFLRSTSNQAVSNVLQLRESFGLPILGAVSLQDSKGDLAWRRLRSLIFGAALLGLVVVYAGLLFIEINGGVREVLPSNLLSKINFDWLAQLLEY